MKKIIFILLVLTLAGHVSAQKYTNGTRVLKGIEVMSATPLQLDYVLENLSDTVKITTHLHEGKTHLVPSDNWREWWYINNKWQPKMQKETDPVWNSTKDSYATKEYVNSLLDVNARDFKLLYALNKRAEEVPGIIITNHENATEFNFDGAQFRGETDGFMLYSSFDEYGNTQLDTRGGIYFDVNHSLNSSLNTSLSLEHARISATAAIADFSGQRFTTNISNRSGTKTNVFETNENKTTVQLRNNTGSESNFTVENGVFLFNTQSPYERRDFSVGLDFSYDRFLNYHTHDTTLRVTHAITLNHSRNVDNARIELTGDNDLLFSSGIRDEYSESYPNRITLTEIIEKGKILIQSSEPQLSENSFAFWVSGNEFYLILKANNTQKKLKFN